MQVCVWKRVAAWNSLNREELTGRAGRSLPFRLGAWGEDVWWQCVCVWEGAVHEVWRSRHKSVFHERKWGKHLFFHATVQWTCKFSNYCNWKCFNNINISWKCGACFRRASTAWVLVLYLWPWTWLDSRSTDFSKINVYSLYATQKQQRLHRWLIDRKS